jgi:deoxyribonuclease-4
MKYVGAHVSVRGGVENAPLNAKAIGAGAFALFTKNPRQWAARPLTSENVDRFRANMKKAGFSAGHVLPHAGYLLNLARADRVQRRATWKAFVDETARCELLGLKYINIHPGMTKGEISEKKGLGWVADCLNYTLEQTSGVTAVLENTTHKFSLGYRFEQLAAIIEGVEDKQRVGVCLDTCHAFGAGYDVRTAEDLDATMKALRKVIPLKYLKGAHLNDSKADLGSHIDRHENLGKGKIGTECFRALMNDRRFDNIPLILETRDPDLWPREIKMLHRFEPHSTGRDPRLHRL